MRVTIALTTTSIKCAAVMFVPPLTECKVSVLLLQSQANCKSGCFYDAFADHEPNQVCVAF